MIISRIKGSNILKYRRLELAVPAEGLIAVSGPNESGKSSIGEAVCFALFGRTFSIGPEELDKVVRWGENHCSVTLDFRVGEEDYELSRMLDRDGNHGVRLLRIGDSEPLARGVRQVADRLTELLGFEYEQFVESFYLAQREITTPHPHSQAVKIMAGIAPLEQVADEIRAEIAERGELREEVQAEIETLEQALDELDADEGRLSALQERHARLWELADQLRGAREEIAERLEDYARHLQAARRAHAARGRASFFRFLFFLLALAAGAVWWLLGQGGDMPQAAQLRELLDRYLPQLQQVPLHWLLGAAGGFGLLFLLSWVRAAAKGRRERQQRAEAGRLAEPLRRVRDLAGTEAAPRLPFEEEAESSQDEEAAPEDASAEPPPRPDPLRFDTLLEAIACGEAPANQAREHVEQELAWLVWVERWIEERLSELAQRVECEQERLHEAAGLEEVLSGQRAKREEIDQRIDLRRTALELLDGATSHLSSHFNRDIRDLVARLLPRFTEGRYEHLRVDEALNVQVFSAEKRDFMNLEEVSSGTQRQIMLALRLALSQKLLARKVRGRQFAFLDEPFAFFDEERTRQALVALTALGEDISQVWIVAQSFPEGGGVAFDVHIRCARDQDELVAGVE